MSRRLSNVARYVRRVLALVGNDEHRRALNKGLSV